MMRFFYFLLLFLLVSGCQSVTPFQAKEKPQKPAWTCQSSQNGQWQCEQLASADTKPAPLVTAAPETAIQRPPKKTKPPMQPAAAVNQQIVSSFPTQGWCLQAIATQDKSGVISAFERYQLEEAWYVSTERDGVQWHHLLISTHKTRNLAHRAKAQISIPAGYPELWPRDISQLAELMVGSPERLSAPKANP